MSIEPVGPRANRITLRTGTLTAADLSRTIHFPVLPPERIAEHSRRFATVMPRFSFTSSIDIAFRIGEGVTIGTITARALNVGGRPVKNTLFIYEPGTVNVTIMQGDGGGLTTDRISVEVLCFELDSSSDVLISGGTVNYRLVDGEGNQLDVGAISVEIGLVRYYADGELVRTVNWSAGL